MPEVQNAWETLESRCRSCRRCEGLADARRNVVFGVGSVSSKILFVGEAPGEQEDARGEPFVGRAGQLLDRFLIHVGLPRETVYIANILKCRPPSNRDPLPEEQDACMEYLWEQVRLLDPKILVCLGRIAAKKLISEDYKITAEHGRFTEKNGILMTAVYHPAALLRDPNKKPETLLDFVAIRAKAEELGIV